MALLDNTERKELEGLRKYVKEMETIFNRILEANKRISASSSKAACWDEFMSSLRERKNKMRQ